MQISSTSYREVFTPTLRYNRPVHYDGCDPPLPAEEITQVHWHDVIELGVCTQGRGIFYCRDHMEPIREGDVLLILPGVRHYSRSLDSCRCRFLYADVYRLFGMLGITDGIALSMITDASRREIPMILRNGDCPELTTLICTAVRGYVDSFRACGFLTHGHPMYHSHDTPLKLVDAFMLLAARMLELLLLCKERFPSAGDRSSERTVLIPAVEHIALQYNRRITEDDLAELCHVSRSTLRRQFMAEYGMTPFAYLTRFRCRTAAMLLLHTEYSVGEIAERVGYKDSSDFYRNFVAWKHVTPSEYRKKGEGEA